MYKIGSIGIKSGRDFLKEEKAEKQIKEQRARITERLNVRAIGLAQKFDRLVEEVN